jgi:tRNA-dihydrouridine synthase A
MDVDEMVHPIDAAMNYGGTQAWRFCVAPMMEWTDRHCRTFHRLLTRRALLYTEMVTAAAVLYGDKDRLLGFDPFERPLAVQLGGSDAGQLASAARICADYGYNEINLNVGCPSDRVQEGRFGACLMSEPHTVAECVSAMQAAVPLPVTVKCRIGIDDQDSEEDFNRFIETVSATGCRRFIVHARKAWLKGLSPKENRDVPPLDYERVYRLKAVRPELTVVINGGIQTLAEAAHHLQFVDGVMLGRAAYQNPAMLAEADAGIYGDTAGTPDLVEVFAAMIEYASRQTARGEKLSSITRHMLGLFQGVPGARAYRRHLTVESIKPGASVDIMRQAIALVRPAASSHPICRRLASELASDKF